MHTSWLNFALATLAGLLWLGAFQTDLAADDAAAKVSSSDVGWPVAADTTATLIGANQNTNVISSHLNATVDDVRLYARAISAAEVAAMAQ